MSGETKATKEQSEWEKNFSLTPNLDLNFVIGANRGYPVGLHGRYDNELKRRVAAALLSYLLGGRSIDYVYKKHLDDHNYDLDRSIGSQIDELLEDIISRSRSNLLELTDRKIARIGEQAADGTLLRALPTLTSSKVLANRGLLFETLCLVRFILEQLAWACGAEPMDDENALLDLRVKSCVKKLDSIYPTAGRVYGFLSDFAHWHPKHHHLFLFVEGSQWGYVTASSEHRAIALCYVLLAADMHLALIEAIHHDSVKEYVVLSESIKGQFKKNRSTRKLVEKAYQAFPKSSQLKQALSFFP